MEIITRQDAISRRLARYFTGQPCKRGHISERYTKMSACIECLHPSFDAEDVKARRKAREHLLNTLSRMTRIKIRLHINDRELFESAVLGAAICREPSLHMKHIRARFTPKQLGTNLHVYGFMAFPEDVQMLRDLQDTLERARRPLEHIPALPVPDSSDHHYPELTLENISK